MRTLSGLGVSAGVGQAHALVVSPAPGLPASDPSRGAEADLAKVEAALGKVADRLDERSLHADPSALAVLQATAMMLAIPGCLPASSPTYPTGMVRPTRCGQPSTISALS
ncbi:phosphoenolpyruvate-protein phosphotransferase of PTS system [Cutibacterium acnes JCM 18909]|nr:phosphoenolpyruvate-protein phosphotransferase of PTS system [Cutibacterium acnes JCM 18909]